MKSGPDRLYPLVLASDAEFAMLLATTTLRSIVESNAHSWPIEVYILSECFSDAGNDSGRTVATRGFGQTFLGAGGSGRIPPRRDFARGLPNHLPALARGRCDSAARRPGARGRRARARARQAFQLDTGGWPIGRWQVPLAHAEIDARHLRGKPGCIIHPTVMMRKSALEAVHGYRPELELAEDYDLFMRLAETGGVANLDEYLLKYRLHEKSVTVSRSAEQYRATGQALRNAWQRRAMPGEAPLADCGKTSVCRADLLWYWSYSALTEKHFKPARKYARRLVAADPGNTGSWMLLAASSLGPMAFAMRNLIPFRPSRSR